MQNWESLVFATVLATVFTFLFLWVLQYTFKRVFSEQELDFLETVSFEDRRKSMTIDLVFEKVISIEEKVDSIEKKISNEVK